MMPETEPPITGAKSYPSLEPRDMSSTAVTVNMDEDNGNESISQENPRKKKKQEFENPKAKSTTESLMGRVRTDLQDQHHLIETVTVPSLPSIYCFKDLYPGRDAFERFVVKSFQRVNSTDLNERKASCVKVLDFHKHLNEFCRTNRLYVPSKVNCRKHLAFMGAKKLQHSRTYIGLRWKESAKEKKNYNNQSKFAEMNKLRMKNQKAEHFRFVPHPKYIINLNVVTQEGTKRVWKSTDLCFSEHEEVEPEVMNVNFHRGAKFRLGSELNVSKVAGKLNNVEAIGKPPKVLRMQLRKPAVTALLYNTGKVFVTGNLDRKTLKKGARRIARIVQKVSVVPVTFGSFHVQHNIVYHKLPCRVMEDSRIMLLRHLSYDLDEGGTTNLVDRNFMRNTVHFKDIQNKAFSTVHFKLKGSVRIVSSSAKLMVETFKKFCKVLMMFYGRQTTQYEEHLDNHYIEPPKFVDIM